MDYDKFHREFYEQIRIERAEEAHRKKQIKKTLIIGAIILCLISLL